MTQQTEQELIKQITNCKEDELEYILENFDKSLLRKVNLRKWRPALDRLNNVLSNIVKSTPILSLSSKKNNLGKTENISLVINMLSFFSSLLDNAKNRAQFSSLNEICHLLACERVEIVERAMMVIHCALTDRRSSTPCVLNKEQAKRVFTLANGYALEDWPAVAKGQPFSAEQVARSQRIDLHNIGTHSGEQNTSTNNTNNKTTINNSTKATKTTTATTKTKTTSGRKRRRRRNTNRDSI
eukprot:gb/GECH01005655.1/.p1 GENE.gb/GECH01005655.1/~~gb/GECH01005655.1/.p1  ORF type:complete len:241 (+),score=52.89 gb/GECH01005655.1/:1-723(+)